MRNKKGFVIVYVMLIFLSLQILIFTLIYNSRELAIESSIKSLGQLWSQSILAEYDKNLYNEYGLFGYYGYEKDINSRLKEYVDYSLEAKKYIDYEIPNSDLINCTLVNGENIMSQIRKIVRYDEFYNYNNRKEKETSKQLGSSENKKNRYCGILLNNRVIRCLPSNNETYQDISISLLDKKIVNKYLNRYFKDKVNDKGIGETLFSYEREYILAGSNFDRKNCKIVKSKIIGIRCLANLAYLMTDKEKCAKALAEAKILTAGTDVVVVQGIILAKWALKESVLDFNVLESNKVIPLLKTKETWGKSEMWTEGKKYNYFLDMLSGMIRTEKLFLRMMDIIQLNMKLNYYDDFQLRDYNSCLLYTIKVNGNTYEFNKKY